MTSSGYKLIKRVLLLAAVLLALGVSEAQATPFTPELEADYVAALAWWGVASPPECASVTSEMLVSDPFTEEDGMPSAMRATEPSSGVVGFQCHLYVFEDALAEARAYWNAGAACIIEMDMRHEVGHLTGHGHSQDPTSIMHTPPEPSVWCPGAVEALAAKNHAIIAGQEWASWRKRRGICRGLQSPYRAKCFRNQRRSAAYLRSRGY